MATDNGRSSGTRTTITKQTAARRAQRLRERPRRPEDHSPPPKGRLLIVGGHEDKEGKRTILRALAAHVGAGKLVVATLASEQPEALWEEYERVFRSLGVAHVHHLDVRCRADGESPRALQVLHDAAGVFFTGGDQLRITSQIGDTPAYSTIQELFERGAIIAGTSAGASVMSETMIVGGGGNASARVESTVRLAPGLGFAKDLVIDQHFAARGRIARLIGVVAANPRILGVGIDENTAILVEPQRRFQVVGDGAVYVVDGTRITDTNMAEEENQRALSVHGVVLHVLSQGDEFDLATRTPTIRPAEEVDERLGMGDGERDESSAADD